MDTSSQPPQPSAPFGQTPPEIDYSKPVAWDQSGQPLYARPPEVNANAPQQVMHIAHSINPADEPIPPEIQQLAEESRKKYPQLNLSQGEYIITAVKRHPIGLFQIWAGVLLVIAAFSGLFGILFSEGITDSLSMLGDSSQITSIVALILIVIFAGAIGGGFIATYIYNANRFYLTNESVIQEIQTGLFTKREQTVSLSNIEDASYHQAGILQSMLDFGSIRLSTQGDETTYRFNYVAAPKKNIAVLNNAVEAFKNGRPIHE